MKQRYTKRIVAFVLALAMVLTGGAFSTVFNTASASAASKKATLKLKKKVSITAGKKVTLKITKKNVKKIKSHSGNLLLSISYLASRYMLGSQDIILLPSKKCGCLLLSHFERR